VLQKLHLGNLENLKILKGLKLQEWSEGLKLQKWSKGLPSYKTVTKLTLKVL